MHILQAALGFLPADAWGGPVKIMYNNAKELIHRGHQVTVYCTNLLNKKEKIQPHTFEHVIEGIRVVYFNAWHIPRWPGTLGPIWLPELKARLQREAQDFDVIHLNGYRNLMNLQIVNAIRDTNIPLVMQPHGTMPVIVNSFFVKRLYDQLLGKHELVRVQTFLALQESEKRQIMAHGISAPRIEIIPNGLSSDNNCQKVSKDTFRRQHGIPADKKLILFLGRINRKKGTDMLVEAFSRLDDTDAYLAIVGPDDGQLAEVQALIRQHNLGERVILPGLLSGSDVLQAYRDADLFVLPCRTDTFPTTIMEACLAEVPMVVTDTCEIAYLVKDRVAEVVPFDTAEFAGAMQRVLSDAKLYQKYKENCHQIMQDTFSLKATVDQLQTLYQRVIAARHLG